MTKVKPTIWVDADACPKIIKEVIFTVSGRLELKIVLVANMQMHIPLSPHISLVKVAQGADVADHHIAENCLPTDIIITADIPLAALIVAKGAVAINVRGELYTEENIGERLSIRDFMKEVRDSGEKTGGPLPFGPKDKELFTNSLNRILTQRLK
ncbi:MAG: YaiI/YqxD family protein [Bacteriovoracaceae bacterium]